VATCVIDYAQGWGEPLEGRQSSLRRWPYCGWCPKAPICPALVNGGRSGEDYSEAVGGPVDGLKVGGWPALIQGEIF
jgi:hypothetical protein